MHKKDLHSVSFRLSIEARQLLVALAERNGTTKTGVIEAVIRQMAQAEGIREPKQTAENVIGPRAVSVTRSDSDARYS